MLALVLALLAQTPAAKPGVKIDACALVANEDIKAVLGADVKERRPGMQQARGLLLSQCYLGTGTPRSVSIAVAGNTTSGGRTITPRAFWRDQFHADEGDGAGRQASVARSGTRGSSSDAAAANGKEKETAARPIGGIGDEAFWSGTRVAGALYVLRGKTFIRVSVGGIGDERDRIEKSRGLAVAALARLPR